MDQLNSFDRIAPYYDRLARIVFNNSIKEAQFSLLSDITTSSSILVLGGGTGTWLNQLLTINRDCQIYYVEASSKMITLARRGIVDADRVHFIHGTEKHIPSLSYDALITFFYLDMFSDNQLRKLVSCLQPHLKLNSKWLVVDFVNTKIWHAILLRIMFFFFRCIGAISNSKLPDWEGTLNDASYQVVGTGSFFADFIQARIYVKKENLYSQPAGIEI
ncbi:MAG: class I SAM-dependent methyltransferase [Cyclobacteriaceae bacterium]|nr:class I SAM-dependent methyltransferase [Cyclobacteriaceae bacterium]